MLQVSVKVSDPAGRTSSSVPDTMTSRLRSASESAQGILSPRVMVQVPVTLLTGIALGEPPVLSPPHAESMKPIAEKRKSGAGRFSRMR
jgi:hypothetical protein